MSELIPSELYVDSIEVMARWAKSLRFMRDRDYGISEIVGSKMCWSLNFIIFSDSEMPTAA